MKKWIALLILASAAMAGNLHAAQKQFKKSQVRAQLEQLLAEHQNFLLTAYNGSVRGKINAAWSPAEQGFFSSIAFMQDAQIQNFLRNVEYDIEHSGRPGVTMMSYTSYVMTGGQTRAIQYTYQSNGKDITLVKQTSENGNMLRSVYYYDIENGSLKADDFSEGRKIHEKVYKI